MLVAELMINGHQRASIVSGQEQCEGKAYWPALIRCGDMQAGSARPLVRLRRRSKVHISKLCSTPNGLINGSHRILSVALCVHTEPQFNRLRRTGIPQALRAAGAA